MNHHVSLRTAAIFGIAVSAIILLSTPAPAAEKTNTWQGSAAPWSDAPSWSLGEVPNNNGTDSYWAIVDGSGTLTSYVPVDMNATVTTATVSVRDTVEVQNGFSLGIDGGRLQVDGLFRLSGSSSSTDLRLLNGASVAGSGVIALTDNPNNRIYPSLDKAFAIGPNTSIEGSGQIGINEGGFTSYGSIAATGDTYPLTIDTRQPMTFENHGYLWSNGPGGITLDSANVNNYNSPLDFVDGSQFTLNNSTLDNNWLNINLMGSTSMFINSSTVRNAAIPIGGAMNFTGTSTVDDVVSTGTAEQANGSTVYATQGLWHDGLWNMNAAGAWTNLQVNNGSSLSGNIELALTDSPNNRIYPQLDGTLTFSDYAWLHGAGQLGINNGGLVNYGSITADGTNPIQIDTRQPQTFENFGYLRASGPGGLIFNTATVFNYNQPIHVGDGSRLEMRNSTLVNNGLDVLLEDSGQLNVDNSSINDAGIRSVTPERGGKRGAGEVTYSGTVSLTDVASTTTVQQLNGSTVNSYGNLFHTGDWYMQAGASWTNLIVRDGGSLYGQMNLRLTDTLNNHIYPQLDMDMFIGPDVVIEGAGNLGVNEGGFYNEGALLATGTNPIRIDTRQPKSFDNWGTMVASGPGGFLFDSANVFNHALPIEIGAGSRLSLLNSTLVNDGLAVNFHGDAPMTVQDSSIRAAELNGADGSFTFYGTSSLVDVVSSATVWQVNGATVNVYGDFPHTGMWRMAGGATQTNLVMQNWNTLLGNMELVLSDSPNNRIYPALDQDFFVDSTVTIRGAGNLLVNNGGMWNYGRIAAEGTNPIRIDSRQPQDLDNYGTLEAIGVGGLYLDTATVRNFNHPITVEKTSKLVMNSSTLEGFGLPVLLKGAAPMSITNSTVLDANLLATSGTITLAGAVAFDNVPTSGTVVQTDGCSVNIAADQVLDGRWYMDGNTTWTHLIVNNSGMLKGSMELALSDSLNNLIYPELNREFTFGPDVVLRGAGRIGANAGGIENKGQIYAEGANPILIDTRQPLAFTNFGTMECNGPGGLYIDTSDFNNEGAPLVVHDGSKLTLVNSTYNAYSSAIIAEGNAPIGFYNSSLNSAVVSLDTGTFSILGSNSITDSEISGHVVQSADASVTLTDGQFSHEGVWEMQGEDANTDVIVGNDGTIGGAGIMNLSASPYNRIYPALFTTMHNGPDHSISGAGSLIANQGGLINEGTIAATEAPGMTFDIRTEYDFGNRGVLQAFFPGTIDILDSTGFWNEGLVMIVQTALTTDGDYTQYDGITSLSDGTMNLGGAFNLYGGSLVGFGTINGDLMNDGGIVAPGPPASLISVSGNYSQSPSGTSSFDVYPAVKRRMHQRGSAAANDQMNVGIAQFGGRIEVVFNGYAPTLGEIFSLINFEVASGTFDEVAGINLPEGLALEPNYGSSSFSVRVIAEPQVDPLVVNSAMIPATPGKAFVSFRDDNPTSTASYLVSIHRVGPTGTWFHEEIVNFPSAAIGSRGVRVAQTPIFDLPLADNNEPTSWEGDYGYSIFAYPELDAMGTGMLAASSELPIPSTQMGPLDVTINPDGSYTLRLTDMRPTGANWMYDYVFYEQSFLTSRSIITPLHTTDNGRINVVSASDVGTSQVLEFTYTPAPGAKGWFVRSLMIVYGADEGRIGQFDVGFQSPYVHGTVPFGRSTGDIDGDGFGDELELALGSSPVDAKHRPAFADVDGDGFTTMLDAIMLSRIAGDEPLPWRSYDPAWDVDADGAIDRRDGEALYRWITGSGEYDYLPAK